MNVVLEPATDAAPLGTILLFFPRFAVRQYPIWLPYELMTLGTALERAGYRVVLIDERLVEDSVEQAARWASEALFVGISSRPGDQVVRALDLFRLLKQRLPEVPTVWGGWFPSSFPDACLAIHEVDFVVQGAADHSIVTLAENIRLRGGDVTGERGLNGGLPGREVVRNPRRPLEDINLTPEVDWSRFPLADYVTSDGTISHYTSRGCPGNCRFCGVTRLYPATWTGYSADRVLADLDYFRTELGVRIVKFQDVDLFGDPERIKTICRGMAAARPKLRWIADIRAAVASKLDEETWRTIADSGCAELELGAESGAEEQLESIHKECNRDDIVTAVGNIVAQGISARVNFVLGFPGETSKSLAASLDLMLELQDLSPLVRLHFYRFTPSPSTRLGAQTWKITNDRHRGWTPESAEDLNAIAVNYPASPMFWLDPDLEEKIHRLLTLYLPLAFYEPTRRLEGTRARIVARLARLARARIRRRLFVLPFEAELLAQLGVVLPGTREFEWAENEVEALSAPFVIPGASMPRSSRAATGEAAG